MIDAEKHLRSNPQIIEELNDLSGSIRVITAKVISERLGSPVVANALPKVEFVANRGTESTLRTWAEDAVPGLDISHTSRIGDTLVRVQYHPEALVQWANMKVKELSKDADVQEKIKRHGFPDDEVADRYLEMAGVQMMIVGMLSQFPDLDPAEIESDVIDISRQRR